MAPETPQIQRAVSLLDADPSLAHDVAPEVVQRLRPSLMVDVMHMHERVWNPLEVELGPEPRLGMLVLDGLMERDVRVAGRTAAELLGPGDVLRPWDVVDAVAATVPVEATWTLLGPASVALLDARVTAAVFQSPELALVLMTRTLNRARSLVALLAIAQIRRLDVRILTLLWHLADRFGRVRPDGVAVEVPLKHASIAKLLAATRPSVSTALADLASRGEVERLTGGGWLLKGDPPAV